MNGELIAGLTLGGLGIAAAGVATSLAIWNAGRYDDWSAANDRLSKGSNPPNPANHAIEQQQNDNLARSIRATSWVTVSVGVASAALLTSGVVLYLRSRRANRSGEVTAAASPSSESALAPSPRGGRFEGPGLARGTGPGSPAVVHHDRDGRDDLPRGLLHASDSRKLRRRGRPGRRER